MSVEEVRAARDCRVQRVAELRAEGKSLRVIAEEVGVSKDQVAKDLKEDCLLVDNAPSRITTSDGRTINVTNIGKKPAPVPTSDDPPPLVTGYQPQNSVRQAAYTSSGPTSVSSSIQGDLPFSSFGSFSLMGHLITLVDSITPGHFGYAVAIQFHTTCGGHLVATARQKKQRAKAIRLNAKDARKERNRAFRAQYSNPGQPSPTGGTGRVRSR